MKLILLAATALWATPTHARTYARCPNGQFASKTKPCPAPTPPPAQTTGPSDAIGGLSAIASGFDFNLALQPAWGTGAIPPSAAPDVVGAFRFICGAGQLLYDDPIVFPGQPGKSHLHQFYGNTAANAYSTYQSLRTTGQSTCANGAYPGNRTPYWTPAMLDGKGHVVQPDWAALYYKRHPLSDPKCSLTRYMRHSLGLSLDGPPSDPPAWGTPKNIQTISFFLGRVLVHLNAARIDDYSIESRYPLAEIWDECRIWPFQRLRMIWPRLPMLDDRGILIVTSALAKIIDAGDITWLDPTRPPRGNPSG